MPVKNRTIHRTAVFALHHPTRHVRAVLERAFKLYSIAYAEALHAARKRYDADALRGLASYQLADGRVRQSAQQLKNRLYQDAEIARTLSGVSAPLEGRLRQSLREHVAQSLMSYVALADAQAQDQTRGGAPDFPSRLREGDVERTRLAALRDLATLADDRTRERDLVAQLQRTRQRARMAIPFVGVDPRYGCGLYWNARTRRFYARLDVVATGSRHARAIAAAGVYADTKTGVRYASDASRSGATTQRENPVVDAADTAATVSFGRGGKSVLVPLAFGRWRGHGAAPRRQTLASSFLRPVETSTDLERMRATPVSAKLVRRVDESEADGDEPRYELHVAFELSAPEPDGLADAERPLLAINRGLYQLYAGVVATPDARRVLATCAASGTDLMAVQRALERRRAARARRGPLDAGDRRQSRIAAHHIARCANEVAAVAARHRAQVVVEDLGTFASGHAVRTVDVQPAARRAALRAMLNRRQFERLRRFLDWRLEEAGLPPARTVPAGYISQTCPACGHRSAENRDGDEPRRFRCARCGTSGDIDLVAAANIARRLVWLRLRGDEKRAGVVEEARTPWADFAARTPLVLAPSADV